MKKLGKFLGVALATAVVALALVSTAVRVALMTLDDVHPLLSRWASELFDVRMEIGQATSEWRGVAPSVVLEDVTLRFDGEKTVHHFGQVMFSLDLLQSLLELSLVPERVVVTGGSIQLQRLENGQWGLEGMPMKPADAGLGLPVDRLQLREVKTVLHDQKTDRRLDLGGMDLDWDSGLFGFEALARSRDEMEGEVELELHVELGALGSGAGMFRLGGAKLEQLRPWLPDGARALTSRLPGQAGMQAEAQLAWENQAPKLAGIWLELEQPQSDSPDWRQMSAAFKWRALEKGYAIALESVELDQEPVVGGAYVEHHGELARGSLDFLDLRRAKRVAAAVGYRVEDFLPGGIVSGTLSQAGGEFRWEDPPRYSFRSQVQDLELSAPGGELRVTGLKGGMAGTGEGVRVDLDSADLVVSYAPWNLDAFRPGPTTFRLEWWPAQDCCAFRLTDLRVENPALRFQGAASMSAAEPRRLQADIRIEHAELPVVSQWLPPGLLPEAEERWVRGAFRAGRLSEARLRLDGPLSPGGFEEAGAELTLAGTLEDLDLDYLPGLPMFENLQGRVFVDGKALHVLAREMKIMESVVTHGALRMGDLGRMDLYSSGVVEGPVSDLPEFLEKAEWMAPAFNEILRFEGDSVLDLALNLPLDERLGKEVAVRAVLRLAGNRLDVLPNDVSLTALEGEMRYADEELSGSLDARFMGRAARIGVTTDPSGDLRLRVRASASPRDYLPKAARPVFSWLDGHSAWDMTLLLPGLSESSRRERLSVSAASDLRGIRIDLPEPLAKAKASRRPLEVKANIEFDGAVDMTAEYSDQARARLKLSPEGVAGGIVSLGTVMPDAPTDSMLKITGRLPEVRMQDWLDWSERHAGVDEGVWPEIHGLEVERLSWHDFEVDAAEVSARFAKGGGRFTIDAPVVRGTIDVPGETGGPVQGVFDWLHLPMDEAGSMSGQGRGAGLDPQDLPPLDLKVHTLHLGPYKLRDVDLATSPGHDRVVIDRLDAKSRNFSMALSGYWALRDGQHSTLLRGDTHTDDLHETLNHWAIKNPLRQGVIDMGVKLQWPGAPYDYALGNLQGDVQIKGKDGRIRDVAPELARVLALLNLEMIFKRLSLDFDDVTRSGFTYQTAEGNFDFVGGSVYTKEFRIIGPSAQFLIKGRIGVEQEDYDLVVIATPETSVLLPAIGAVGGPVGIAGAFFGTKVLEWLGFEINTATAVTYKVTGAWSEPVIEEVVPGGASE